MTKELKSLFLAILFSMAGISFLSSCAAEQEDTRKSSQNPEPKTTIVKADAGARQRTPISGVPPDISDSINLNFGQIFSHFENTSPKKIISIAPSTTELLYEYGVGNLIIGAVEPHDYPGEAKKLESVGNLTLNVEKIVLLKPDIIIGEKDLFKGQLASLDGLGIPLLLFETKSPSDLFFHTFVLDKLFHQSKATKLNQETNDIIARFPRPEKPIKIACVISSAPLMLACKDSYMSGLIEFAGCKNVADDIPGDYSTISREELIGMNPDVILFTFEGIGKELKNEKSFDGISAVKAHRLYLVNPDIFLRPTLRSIRDGVIIIRGFCE
jgi:iron complex transport system substrate-binding protein